MARLDDLGEKKVVSRILERLSADIEVGPGDDAAAIDMGLFYLVVSTDLVSTASHFPEGMTDRQLGWMMAAVNYSDIAAMGAEPLGLVMAMALPRALEVERVLAMVDGAEACSKSVGASLIGGDTKESAGIVLSGTAIGKVEKDGLLRRSGAREGDLLAVTGDLGIAAAGFFAIREGIRFPEGERALMEPVPRVREGRCLSQSGVVTSCVDISDGLAHSIHLLSDSSGVGFELDWDSIPIGKGVAAVARECGIQLEELVLHFGGDYQLLFTVAAEGMGALRNSLPETRVIGKVIGGRENVLSRQGKIVELENRGWEHFGR